MLRRLIDLIEKKDVVVLAGDIIPIASPLSIVSPQEETQGILLGVDDKNRTIYLNPYILPNVHGIILGTSGSGKSTLARHLILEFRELGVKAWVLDPHAEEAYERLFSRKFTITEDKINILKIPGWDKEEYSSELSRYIELIYGFKGARNVIRELLLMCIEESTLDPLKKIAAEDPDISRLYDDLKKIHGPDTQIDNLADEDVYFTFPLMFSREFMQLSLQILLLLLQGYRRSRGTVNRLEQIVILEEAHLFSHYLLRLYKEVRKWGYTLISVSQLPREFDSRIYQLSGFVIILSGSESYLRDISLIFSLNSDEQEHVLFAPRGACLYIRQGDPRPRKVFLKIRKEALA